MHVCLHVGDLWLAVDFLLLFRSPLYFRPGDMTWLYITTTHLFNGPFSGTTKVGRYQKGKPIYIIIVYITTIVGITQSSQYNSCH